MNRVLVSFAIILAASASAQLTNGSFEQGLVGWEWTCSDPPELAGGAPGAGAVYVTKESGQTQGCFPSYLFQRLNAAQDGDLITISGWVRCHDAPPCLGAYFGLGTVSNGLFHLEENVGTLGSEWVYLTITDTVEIASGDTAILVLNSGLIGGPINPSVGFYDGFTASIAMGVGENVDDDPLLRFDRAGDNLFISTGIAHILEARLFDLTGRHLPALGNLRNTPTARIDLHGLPNGVYLVALRTVSGERVVRFALE